MSIVAVMLFGLKYNRLNLGSISLTFDQIASEETYAGRHHPLDPTLKQIAPGYQIQDQECRQYSVSELISSAVMASATVSPPEEVVLRHYSAAPSHWKL